MDGEWRRWKIASDLSKMGKERKMRPVDADALKEEICKRYPHLSQRLAIWPVFEEIKKAQTLDAVQVERKKGRWINKKNVYGVAYCSNCDYELHTDDTNFCPNCGVYMRERKEE